MEFIGSLAIAGVIIAGGNEVIEDRMTVGSFFSFLTALFMLYTPLKKISSAYNQMQDAFAASDRIFDILGKKPTIISGDKILNQINQIELKNINLNYGELKALNNINLLAKKGELIALVGDSGGGKSSLINLLLRFYDSNQGEILFDNQNIKDLNIDNLRDKIALVSQRIFIFNDTISSNIAYGKEINNDKIIKVLKQANAFDFVNNLENGIDTILDEFGTNLSGGQRQRISIARAIYRNPEILIFDEATSALDNKSEKAIQDSLKDIMKDKITFIIAHRLSTIQNADKIFVLKDGKIICSGDENYLINNCEEYRRLKQFKS